MNFGDVTDVESLRKNAFSQPIDVVVSCMASRSGGKVIPCSMLLYYWWRGAADDEGLLLSHIWQMHTPNNIFGSWVIQISTHCLTATTVIGTADKGVALTI